VPNTSNYDMITPTALLMAYYRSFSDIPYAKQCSTVLGGERAARLMLGEDLELLTIHTSPFIEARYKCFDRFIAHHDNVLELAMGASVERGIGIAADPCKVYVGTDLADMIMAAGELVDTIQAERHPNHHLDVANALYYGDLLQAAKRFVSPRELLVIHEGFFQYLTADEQVACARSIYHLLKKYGGRWVTPDILSVESSSHDATALGPELSAAINRTIQRIYKVTDRRPDNGYFRTESEASRFLQECGFSFQQHPISLDASSLSTMERLWGDRERRAYEPLLRRQCVWVMSPL